MAETKKLYIYDGSIKIYDDIVTPQFNARTLASSAEKAAANIAHQYKRSHGLTASVNVRLSKLPKEIK